MKYDRFLAFSILTAQEQDLLNRYASPADESSLVKNVPLELVEEIRSIINKIKPADQRVNTRFRGPRYDSMRQTCLKANARAASIYFNQNWNQ
jgi:hypothetical protein